jgi:hypothetical protein
MYVGHCNAFHVLLFKTRRKMMFYLLWPAHCTMETIGCLGTWTNHNNKVSVLQGVEEEEGLFGIDDDLVVITVVVFRLRIGLI